MFTTKDVEKLAGLSRIALTPQERAQFSQEIEAILGYVSEIQKLGGGEEGADHEVVVNVLRSDDNPHPSGIFTEDLLKAAPKREGNGVRVKRILTQD